MYLSEQDKGFILLHRKLLEWEWWDDINTFRLFVFCLLSANYKDEKWKGKLIKRGSFVTSLDKISKKTGLTIRQTRTALNHLETTNEVTNVSTSKNRIITVNNYDAYQVSDKQNVSKTPKKRQSERQTADKLPTTTNKSNKVSIPLGIDTEKKHSPQPPGGVASVAEIKPRFGIVNTFGQANGLSCEECSYFYDVTSQEVWADWKNELLRYGKMSSQEQDDYERQHKKN